VRLLNFLIVEIKNHPCRFTIVFVCDVDDDDDNEKDDAFDSDNDEYVDNFDDDDNDRLRDMTNDNDNICFMFLVTMTTIQDQDQKDGVIVTKRFIDRKNNQQPVILSILNVFYCTTIDQRSFYCCVLSRQSQKILYAVFKYSYNYQFAKHFANFFFKLSNTKHPTKNNFNPKNP
jgi:hypothetical protein